MALLPQSPPIQKVATDGRGRDIAKKLLQVKIPMCPACQYGKMHKRPWHSKGQVTNNTKVITQPGQTVSVDQLESKTPGFIAQQRVINKKEISKCDSFCQSIFNVFVYPFTKGHNKQRNSTSQRGFQKGQKPAHHLLCCEHALSEWHVQEKIRDLQEATCTSLLFTIHKWP